MGGVGGRARGSRRRAGLAMMVSRTCLHCESHVASSAPASVSHLATNPAFALLNSASSSSESEVRSPCWLYRTSSYLNLGFWPGPGFLRTPPDVLCLLFVLIAARRARRKREQTSGHYFTPLPPPEPTHTSLTPLDQIRVKNPNSSTLSHKNGKLLLQLLA